MKHWQLVLTLGTVLSTPCMAYTSEARFSDPQTQRYYEANRQYYEQNQGDRRRQYDQGEARRQYEQVPIFRGWHHFDDRSGRMERRSRQAVRNTGERRSSGRFKPQMMPDQIPSTGEKTFIFNPNVLTWAAYDANGELVRKGHGSAGRSYCPDIGRACHSPTGTFRVQSKRGPECKSSIYPKPHGGAKMPYCMFFHKSYAIHGSYDVPDYNASHGCLRVYPQDAQWLNSSFMTIGTKVIVKPY